MYVNRLTGRIMQLRDYLYFKKLTIKYMADKLKYSRTHMSLVVNGISKPSQRLADAIEKFTKGEVKASEILKDKVE